MATTAINRATTELAGAVSIVGAANDYDALLELWETAASCSWGRPRTRSACRDNGTFGPLQRVSSEHTLRRCVRGGHEER
jgi:hypothetical protein